MTAKSTWLAKKIALILSAWAKHAADKKFGGMTLAQFKDRVKACETCRADIIDLETQLTAAYDERDLADDEAGPALSLIINGVRADPEHGEDSALYGAMGNKRKSERRSGLVRRKNFVTSIKNVA